MAILHEPTIYLLSRQTLDDRAVQQFLADHGTSWETDSEVGGELLSEMGGRVCFDDKTEVLTNKGWLLFDHLDQTEWVATLNPSTHALEYQRPYAYQTYDYAGDLLCAEGRDISFAVTPEHRQYGRFEQQAHAFVRTDEIADRQFRIMVAPRSWKGEFPEKVEMPAITSSQAISNQFSQGCGVATQTRPAVAVSGQEAIRSLAHLLVYYATEGSLRKNAGSGHGITIYGDHVAGVSDACTVLTLPYKIYYDRRNGVPRMSIGGGVVLRSYFEQECGTGSANKRLPQWVLDLPEEELAVIWALLVTTDGHRYAHGREILCTTSPVLAGQAQEILAKIGFSSGVYEYAGRNHPQLQVSKKKRTEIVLNRHARLQRQRYAGKVYCLSTINGVVFVRRGGKVHFSGNCYMSFGAKQGRRSNAEYIGNILEQRHGSVLEHAAWTFLVTGVSRALTHELIRHRVGMGVSQLSQRYVDETETDFIEPTIIAGDAHLHAIWVEVIEATQRVGSPGTELEFAL